MLARPRPRVVTALAMTLINAVLFASDRLWDCHLARKFWFCCQNEMLPMLIGVPVRCSGVSVTDRPLALAE